MPVNATNNSDITMNIIYMGHNYSHDSFTGGNISNNLFLENYIPQTDLTDKIISIARYGTPVITIGNGSEPKVMIISGVHGNELPAQIASIKTANYLKNKNMKRNCLYITGCFPMGYISKHALLEWRKFKQRSKHSRNTNKYYIKICKAFKS